MGEAPRKIHIPRFVLPVISIVAAALLAGSSMFPKPQEPIPQPIPCWTQPDKDGERVHGFKVSERAIFCWPSPIFRQKYPQFFVGK
jgi:hypothetical protein